MKEGRDQIYGNGNGQGRRLRDWFDAGTVRRLLFALALAALFWGWVTYLEDPETSRTLTGVPLTLVGRADGLVVVDEARLPPVTVEVRGPRSVMDGLTSGDLRATVDLRGITAPGTYELPVEVRGPRGTRISDSAVTPRLVAVTVGRLAATSSPLAVDPESIPELHRIGRVEPANGRVARVGLPVTLGHRREEFEG